MAYDYKENIKSDIEEYIRNEMTKDEIQGFYSIRRMEDYLEDTLFVSSVTGNDNGSYYCNTWKSKEAVEGNEDLAREASLEFGCKESMLNAFFDGDYEYIDVTIRCYLLSECIHEVLNDMEDELEAIMNEEEEEEEE